MSPSAREFLNHIQDETQYLIASSEGLDKSTFLQDETLKRAYVRSLEIIGEAVKQIPETLKEEYTFIEWRSMAGMRDRLIHHYFGVDYDIVWDVIAHKIAELDQQIRVILSQEYP